MDKVTILVPVYGVEQYIERCSRSLFAQSYPNLEYVFVDDCSPDRSIEVVKQVMEDYPERQGAVRIVRHSVNRGLAAARNTALENASGVFVIFVDSDDWLDCEAVGAMMMRQVETNSDMVWGQRLMHEDEGESICQETVYGEKQRLTLHLMQRTFDHCLTGRLFRRAVFSDHGLRWQEGLDMAEDRYLMTLLTYYSRTYASVDCIVYHYERRNPNSMTVVHDGVKRMRYCKEELENLLLLEQFFSDKEPVYQQECARCIIEQLRYNMAVAVECKDRNEYYRLLDDVQRRDGDRGDKSFSLWIKSRYFWKALSRSKKQVIRPIKK